MVGVSGFRVCYQPQHYHVKGIYLCLVDPYPYPNHVFVSFCPDNDNPFYLTMFCLIDFCLNVDISIIISISLYIYIYVYIYIISMYIYIYPYDITIYHHLILVLVGFKLPWPSWPTCRHHASSFRAAWGCAGARPRVVIGTGATQNWMATSGLGEIQSIVVMYYGYPVTLW